jgi:uncharacterized protein YkwD
MRKLIDSCNQNRIHAGENIIYKGIRSVDTNKAQLMLMQSPTHRENILSEKYAKMGIGCFEDICVEFFSD